MKYTKNTAGFSWTHYNKNTDCKETKFNPRFKKKLEYRRKYFQHMNRMACNR